MHAVYFTDTLTIHYRSALEDVLFFNSNQYRLKSEIENSIIIYGTPQIVERGEMLLISFNDDVTYKSLYVLDKDSLNAELLGLLIYHIEGQICYIIHVAINEMCSSMIDENELIFFRLFERLRRDIIKVGVTHIKLTYTGHLIRTSVKFSNAWL